MTVNFSYWEKEHFFHADVVIIGSGIVGLNAALTLQKNRPRWKILVLERGFLPSGASTKNAGFACFGSLSELIEQEKKLGPEGLQLLVEKRWKGLLKLRKLLGDKAIHFENYGGFELFTPTDLYVNDCLQQLDHYNFLVKEVVGDSSTYQVANHKIKALGFKGVDHLIENKFESQIDTGKMMLSLLQLVREKGIEVRNNCEVMSIYEEDKCLRLQTNQGTYKTSQLLLATNAFTSRFLPELDIVPGRGQVLITEPVKNLPFRGTFHYDHGYYYFRNVGQRILIGGGRNLDFKGETTIEPGESTLIQRSLEMLLTSMILPGQKFKIDTRWSGIMAFGNAIEPIIKRVKPTIYCAVRCHGMGVAIGSQTGEEAALLLLQHTSDSCY